MQDPITPILARQGFVLLDGGLATELEQRGCALDDPLWSARSLIDAPDRIRDIHRDFLEAGADVLVTASYQAHFAGFRRHGFEAQAAAGFMRLSVDLAREARAEFLDAAPEHKVPLIAASIGPYGAVLHDGSEYRGDYRMSLRELRAFHRPRLEILLEAEPDLLACETIPSRREAEALLELMDEYGTRPAWISFSCRDERHISDGERFTDAIRQAADCPQVIAVGLNCTAPRYVGDLLRSLEGIGKPLIAYPNSGETWDPGTRQWLPGTATRDWRTGVEEWYAAGARLLGGCCRTTPGDVRAIGRYLRVKAE